MHAKSTQWASARQKRAPTPPSQRNSRGSAHQQGKQWPQTMQMRSSSACGAVALVDPAEVASLRSTPNRINSPLAEQSLSSGTTAHSAARTTPTEVWTARLARTRAPMLSATGGGPAGEYEMPSEPKPRPESSCDVIGSKQSGSDNVGGSSGGRWSGSAANGTPRVITGDGGTTGRASDVDASCEHRLRRERRPPREPRARRRRRGRCTHACCPRSCAQRSSTSAGATGDDAAGATGDDAAGATGDDAAPVSTAAALSDCFRITTCMAWI
jgi:hypothetical protein